MQIPIPLLRQAQAQAGPKMAGTGTIQNIRERKRRNPRFGCPTIAQLLARTLGIDIDKEVVRRVLAAR